MGQSSRSLEKNVGASSRFSVKISLFFKLLYLFALLSCYLFGE